MVFSVPLLFVAAMFVSNLKHAPSRQLPLTASKTVFSQLNVLEFPHVRTTKPAKSNTFTYKLCDCISHADCLFTVIIVTTETAVCSEHSCASPHGD